MIRARPVVLFTVAGLVACALPGQRRSRSCAERYGFEAPDADTNVTAAVELSNRILGDGAKWVFVERAVAAAGEVEVTVAPASVAAPHDFVWTADPACVLVSKLWRSRVEVLFSAAESVSLTVDPEAVLALGLLHETGHLLPVPPIAPPRELALADFEGAEIDARHPELMADAEAARLVNAAAKVGSTGFSAGMRLSMAATNIGWNLQARRQTQSFGSLLLRSPAVFGDRGYSHPNLELRFLVLSYRLAPSSAGRALLQEFLQARAGS